MGWDTVALLLLFLDGSAASLLQSRCQLPRLTRLRAAPLVCCQSGARSHVSIDAVEVGSPPLPKYPPPPSYRECLAFVLNAVGIYAAPNLMSLIDAAFIGRVSTTELAALGPASAIADSAPSLVLFISIAATNMVAKAHSSGNAEGTARVAGTSIALGGAGGVLLSVALLCGAQPISRLYCGSAATVLAPLCTQYVTIRALALPAVVFASVAQAICIGLKDTRTPMVAVAAAAGLNFCADLVLVNGLQMGIAGAAWATALSQLCAAGLLARVLMGRGLLRLPTQRWSPLRSLQQPRRRRLTSSARWQTLGGIFSFIPFLFVMMIKIGMHNACAAAAAALGGAAAAAHTALMAVAWVCFNLGDTGSSLCQAYIPVFTAPMEPRPQASTELSLDLDAAWPTILQLLKCTLTIGVAVVCLSTSLLTLLAPQLTPDPAVRLHMRRVLPLMIATLSTHGTAVTLEGLLLARKDFRGLALTYVGVALSVALLLTLVQASGSGLMGVWGVYVWYCAARALAFAGFGGLLRFSRQSPRTQGVGS